MSYLPPLAYVPTVIPYPGAPGAPMFDGKNVIHFLDLYDQSALLRLPPLRIRKDLSTSLVL